LRSVPGPGRKRALLIRLLLVALVAGAVVWVLKAKRETILRECTAFFESAISRRTDLAVRLGRVRGNLPGRIVFESFEIAEPPEAGGRVFFRCKELQVRYSLLDLLSKSAPPRIEIVAHGAEIWWAPHLALRHPDLPFLGWMRQWASGSRSPLSLRADGLRLLVGDERRAFEGISLAYRDNGFRIEVPLRHLDILGSDVSSTVVVEGAFEMGPDPRQDTIGGRIMTEGTVVDWAPLPRESAFDFILSREAFRLTSSDLLGGARLEAEIRPGDVDALRLSLEGENYALSNLDPFFAPAKGLSIPGKAGFQFRLGGSFWAPSVEGRLLVRDGRIGDKPFKALELNFSGVYPTLRLEGSRMLLEDGTAMRFADDILEVRELFSEKTYRSLVSAAQQDTVVWGDWELSRAVRDGERSDLLMQRSLGDNARVQFRRTNEEREVPRYEDEDLDAPGMSVGFEYRLQSKSALKLEFREDEEFVGVERKMKF